MLAVAPVLGVAAAALMDQETPVTGPEEVGTRGGRSPADVGWDEKRRHDMLVDLGLFGTRVTNGDLDSGMPGKAARVRSFLTQPLVLPPGVTIEQWRGGLRREPRARPWEPPATEAHRTDVG